MRTHLPPACRALAGAALLGVLASGCTSDPAPGRGSAAVATTAPDARGAAAATSRSAELQAGLTSLLVERAHLVAAAARAQGSPPAAAAREALSASSTALADLLGAAYDDAREPLLQALREEDRALAEGGDLAAARAELAAVLRRVVPRLDAAELEQRLGADADVARAALGPDRFDVLRAARESATGTARLLASAVAEDRGLPVPSTRAPLLRAELTGLLAEHVCLAAALARAHAERQDAGPALLALRSNGRELATALGSAYPALGAPFAGAWDRSLQQLDRYAAARAGGGVAAAEAVAVRAFPAEAARLLAEHVDGLPATSSQAELVPALDALLVAVDTAAEGSAAAPSALRVAVADAQPLAALLAAAVAEDLQLA